MAPSRLAHHLRTLVEADLVVQDCIGRQIVNCVDSNAMNRNVSFLTCDCCVGLRELRVWIVSLASSTR